MGRRLPVLVVIAAVCAAAACRPSTAEKEQAPAPAGVKRIKSKTVSPEERADALARAAVWQQPETPIAQVRLDSHPKQPQSINCRFEPTDLGGTAPKFDCILENGDSIRVKYGRSPEIPSEVAAARLLHALGFGADDVMMVEKLRCFGCPVEPFLTMKTLGLAGAQKLYAKVMDPGAYEDFDWVAIERKHYGRPIETEEIEGWAFFELDVIDQKKGGAPKAHVDALRLLAVFLAHWDNKSENQRLVCLSETDWPDGGKCSKPFAMLQDVGGAFGPRKVDLEEWEKAPIWADRKSCTATMDHLPYKGATFQPVKITEAGRSHLAALLGQLSDDQIAGLFRGGRFDHSKGLIGFRASPVAEWARVFKARVRQITDGPRCPQ